MRIAHAGIAFLALTASLDAQGVAGKKSAGLETDWEMATVFRDIAAHAAKLAPMLDRIEVKSWIEKGASDTYAAQLQSAREQVGAVSRSAAAMANNPQKLSGALELYFRIQSIDAMLTSVADGMRRYQSPSAAQSLVALEVENDANRDRLQKYVVNLAAEREQEFQVMDREAQRCRGVLTQLPASRKK